MKKLILDAGPLITACKFGVDHLLLIDHMLHWCEISIANTVRDEAVEMMKAARSRYPSAFVEHTLLLLRR